MVWHSSPVSLRDNRVLEVSDTGPGPSRVLVLHHGTPMTFPRLGFVERVARERDVRLVTFARPGYRTSTRQPGRTVADVAADTRDVLDALSIERAMMAGVSGGGPHALACAALLPDQTEAVASICGVAPYDTAGLDFLAGMGQDNIAEFTATLAGEAQLRAHLDAELSGLREITPDQLVVAWRSVLPAVDQASITGDVGADFAAALRDALAGPVDGWVDDDLAFVEPWGFELSAITVPVTVWQGGRDLMVPFAHGHALSAAVPQAHSHLLDTEGHLSILVGSFGDVLSELVGLGD